MRIAAPCRYDMALMGGVLLKLREQLNTSSAHEAWIVGAAKAGAVLGTYLGGAAMYRYGRRATIGRNSAFFIVGPLLMAAAGGVAQLVAGRLVIGLGIGVSAVVIPAYLGEMAPPVLRGLIVASYEGMLCVGMLAALLVDAVLEVRCMGGNMARYRTLADAFLSALCFVLLGQHFVVSTPQCATTLATAMTLSPQACSDTEPLTQAAHAGFAGQLAVDGQRARRAGAGARIRAVHPC